MPTPTGLQLNYETVSYGSTNIVRVVSMGFNKGGEQQSFSGDNDRYPSVIARTVSRPSCSITAGDVATLFSLSGVAAVTAIQIDALGATGGNIDWSLANAVFVTADETGQWGNFATATAHFNAYSSDGQTNPLTFTRS